MVGELPYILEKTPHHEIKAPQLSSKLQIKIPEKCTKRRTKKKKNIGFWLCFVGWYYSFDYFQISHGKYGLLDLQYHVKNNRNVTSMTPVGRLAAILDIFWKSHHSSDR